MQSTANRDLLVGLFVLVALGLIGYLSLQVGGLSIRDSGGLVLYATFDDIGGLSPRSAVRIGGVRVGRVKAIDLDADLRARVQLDLDQGLELPVDSAAAIRTSDFWAINSSRSSPAPKRNSWSPAKSSLSPRARSIWIS